MTSVLDEHISYLTLPHRQQLYERALASVLKPGDIVADLGCGVGVLGFAALRAGAARVYGIDHSDAIELARESAARAGMADRYHCIRGSTYQTVLPEKVDLIICDHVGFFGFDYGIVAMLDDARQRMLRPGGQVMPRRLRLMAAGTQSAAARQKVDRWLADPVPAEQRWAHEYALNAKHAIDFAPEDICTGAAVLGEIDLSTSNPEGFSLSATLDMARDARVDGLACWFECELADGVWMSNSPLDPDTIRRSNAFFAAREPFMASGGDRIDITFRIRHDDHLVTWTIQPPGGAARQKLSTWAGRILSPEDLKVQNGGPVVLNGKGLARKAVLDLVDGTRTLEQIEQEVQRLHPGLFPSPAAIRRHVRGFLSSDTLA